MKIHIFGGSGTGKTTLSQKLAKDLGWQHIDSDDYYWVKTNPPFQEKIPLEERAVLISQDFDSYDDVILSGSMVNWGKKWESAFDLAVFLLVPPAIRMDRLRKREVTRYGARLQSDSILKSTSDDFLLWAQGYDDKGFAAHRKWMSKLEYPVLKIEGDVSVEQTANRILKEIQLP